MTSKKFVINGMNKIVDSFPFVKCTYQFDRFSNLHSIEVLPEFYLNNPSGFSELQHSIKREFISKFPYERLSFFTNGNIIEIESDNYICSVSGKFYKNHDIKNVELFPDNTTHISNIDSLIDKETNFALAA